MQHARPKQVTLTQVNQNHAVLLSFASLAMTLKSNLLIDFIFLHHIFEYKPPPPDKDGSTRPKFAKFKPYESNQPSSSMADLFFFVSYSLYTKVTITAVISLQSFSRIDQCSSLLV